MHTAFTVLFEGPNAPLRFQNIPLPELRQGDMLVRNEYVTLCRSDLNTYCGKRTEKTPTILGHEVVGRIAAFGPGATREDLCGRLLSIGRRISWAIYAADPESEMAQKGIPQKGSDLFKYGHERIEENSTLHGGLSAFIILRRHTPVMLIDESVPLPVAAIVNCAVATVAGALRLAGAVQGKKVLVSGAGMLGMVACAMLRVGQAAYVAATDMDNDRLEKARLFGADSAIHPDAVAGSNAKFDLVIELSGVPEAMERALECLDIGGAAVWVGATFPQRKVQINAETIVRKLLTIKGLHNYNEIDFKTAVAFVEQNWRAFPFLSLIHDGFSLQDANEAFLFGLEKNPFRVGLSISHAG